MLESNACHHMKPGVSVVIPVRNGMPYLEETLMSVRCQTRTADEVIVIDNRSTDGTREFLSTQTDIEVVTQPSGVSAPANWTTAVRAATRTFVKILCTDDVLLPNCLEKQLDVLMQHNGCVMASVRRQVIGPNSEVLINAIGHEGLSGVVSGKYSIVRGLSRGTNLYGEVSALLFRTTVLQSCLPWPDDAGYATDLAMYLKVLRQGDVYFDHKPLAQFRVTQSSWSFKVRSTQARDVHAVYRSANVEFPLHVSRRHQLSGILFAFCRQFLRSSFYLRVRGSMISS